DRLLADGDRDLDGVLDEAAAELERRRKELHRSAVARYRAQEVDLFLAEELDSLGRSDASGTPATESQRAALVAAGLADPPPDLTAVAAASMLAAINQRRKKGLSTIRQMRVLTRHGIDARRMKFGEASKRLDILALYKWDAAAAAGALEQLAQHEAATAPPARRPRP
ncbi:MAG TPA: hypothetical protein VN253_00685, partial [Kofleriaceae bacterium]|nr:hypothetical protein [Kofleriaceae bacterium]